MEGDGGETDPTHSEPERPPTASQRRQGESLGVLESQGAGRGASISNSRRTITFQKRFCDSRKEINTRSDKHNDKTNGIRHNRNLSREKKNWPPEIEDRGGQGRRRLLNTQKDDKGPNFLMKRIKSRSDKHDSREKRPRYNITIGLELLLG